MGEKQNVQDEMSQGQEGKMEKERCIMGLQEVAQTSKKEGRQTENVEARLEE